MKIAVPSDDQISISSDIESANGFVIIEYENGRIKEYKYRKNKYSGDRSDRSLISFVIKDCDILITNKISNGCYSDILVADIETYFTKHSDVIKAVKLFMNGELTLK